MSPLRRGLLLAVIHVALIGAVAGVLLYDRATLPRVWVESPGVDPDLPIRGRYVALNLLFLPAPVSSVSPAPDGIAVGRLQVRDGTAVALVRPLSEGNQRRDELLFTARQVGDGWRWMLGAPVAFFLVREQRPLSLVRGMNTIVLPDIPATIDGTSLHFASLTDPKSVRVLEQNFQYDLVHHAKLREKYLGKEVEFVRYDPDTKKETSVFGKLLATGWQPQITNYGYGPALTYTYSGQMIAEINGKIEIGPAGRLVLPSLSEGLILKPQLEWMITSTKAGVHQTEISYLATQLSWNCDYVALLNEKDTGLDLTGWCA